MMKKLILSFVVIILLTACQKPQKPEFRGISHPKILKINTQEVKLSANVILHNPNKISLDVVGMEVDIWANDLPIGKTTQTDQYTIEADGNFDIPLLYQFSPKEVFKLQSIGSLLQVIGNKKAQVKYQGFISVKILDIDWKIPFEHEQEVDLKKKK